MHRRHTFSILYQKSNTLRQTRNSGNIPCSFLKHDWFKNFFFDYAITEWNKLNCYTSNSDSFEIFIKRISSFIRPMRNNIYNFHNPLGVNWLARLRIGISHLKEHEFKHNFQNSISLMCSCSSGIETTIHFFLHCANFTTQRKPFLTK